jgi:hypothetical protein
MGRELRFTVPTDLAETLRVATTVYNAVELEESEKTCETIAVNTYMKDLLSELLISLFNVMIFFYHSN